MAVEMLRSIYTSCCPTAPVVCTAEGLPHLQALLQDAGIKKDSAMGRYCKDAETELKVGLIN